MKQFAWYVCLGLIPFSAVGQPPQTELFLFEAEHKNNQRWVVHSPKWISEWNANGYNNQPHFTNEGILLSTFQSRAADQTDIVSYDFSKNQLLRITQTSLSEYSPTPKDDDQFSVIRVESDGRQTLQLYRLDQSAPTNLFPNFDKPIGYHCWLSDTTVALFVLGDPPTLYVANTNDQTLTPYASDIGRCLKRNNEGKLIFVHKYSESFWYLKQWDPSTKRFEIISQIKPGFQDFTISSDGSIWMCQDTLLMTYNPQVSPNWELVADLSAYRITDANRLDFHNNRLAIVATRRKP